jgi:hypothetical protein
MRTLVTFGLGALTMYLLDRENGPQRRARLRSQLKDYSANRAANRAVSTRRQQANPAQKPESAHHLGR